jgi:hypothetical protein
VKTQFDSAFNCFNPPLSARSLHCQADEQQIELRDLKPSVSYNISVTIVSSSHEVRHLGTRVFTTLREDYRPENVTEVWVEQERAIEGDGENVTVFIGWNPARGKRAICALRSSIVTTRSHFISPRSDRTCHYQLIAHGMGGDDFFNELKEDRNLYFHRFTWRYDQEYQVAIRGVNVQNESLKSEVVWKTLTLSDCHSLHRNQSTVCGPRSVTGLKEAYQLVDDNTFDINITWNKPDYLPDSYSVEIRDFFVAQVDNRSVGIYRFDLDGVSEAFQLVRG